MSREDLYRIEKAVAQAALILDGWVLSPSATPTNQAEMLPPSPSEDNDFPESY